MCPKNLLIDWKNFIEGFFLVVRQAADVDDDDESGLKFFRLVLADLGE